MSMTSTLGNSTKAGRPIGQVAMSSGVGSSPQQDLPPPSGAALGQGREVVQPERAGRAAGEQDRGLPRLILALEHNLSRHRRGGALAARREHADFSQHGARSERLAEFLQPDNAAEEVVHLGGSVATAE